jgi:hypothetical protein
MRLIPFLTLAVLLVLGSVCSTAQLEDSHSSESEISQKDDSQAKGKATRLKRSPEQIIESNNRNSREADSSDCKARRKIDALHSSESDSESTDSAQEKNFDDKQLSLDGSVDVFQSNQFNALVESLKQLTDSTPSENVKSIISENF